MKVSLEPLQLNQCLIKTWPSNHRPDSIGEIKVGNHVSIGTIYGKVKAMFNDQGDSIKEALPSTPVEILGLNEVPTPGDILESYESEQVAKSIVEDRVLKQKKPKQTL